MINRKTHEIKLLLGVRRLTAVRTIYIRLHRLFFLFGRKIALISQLEGYMKSIYFSRISTTKVDY